MAGLGGWIRGLGGFGQQPLTVGKPVKINSTRLC